MSDSVHVECVPERNCYEIYLNDEAAGHVDFRVEEAEIEFPSTEVDPKFGGRGLGSALLRAALDDVRLRYSGRKVLPTCPFVESFIAKNPEYQDLLA